jgi:hypothetical protein
MRRILPYLFALVAFFATARLAEAAPCSPSHTFVTGETLTAATLNSNPVTFSGCLSNIDDTNIGAAGFYASQLNPGTSGQATFGSSQNYTFPAGLAVTGTLSSGGLTASSLTTTGSITDGANLGVGGTLGVTGATSLAGLSASSLTTTGSISDGGTLGIAGNTSLGGTLSVTGNTTLGGTEIITGNASALGQFAVGQLLTLNSGAVYKPASTSYEYPFDANSTSGSVNTHVEHGTLTTATFSSGFACAASHNFVSGFTSAPDLVYSAQGAAIFPLLLYTNARSASAFQVCAESNGSQNSGVATISWFAVGE